MISCFYILPSKKVEHDISKVILCVTKEFSLHHTLKKKNIQFQGGGIWGGHSLFRENCIGQQLVYASVS